MKITMRYCRQCGRYHRHDLHGEMRQRSRSNLGAWLAFGLFVAMALVAVFGWYF